MSLCPPHCLECPPIPLSDSLSGPSPGAIVGRRPSISSSSMFASFSLDLTSPRDSFMLVVCLLTCLPHGTRSSLGTGLSLIQLWEPRCSCGPHRSGSSGMCLEWENDAGSRTFSEHAFGSGPDEGGLSCLLLGRLWWRPPYRCHCLNPPSPQACCLQMHQVGEEAGVVGALGHPPGH